MGTYVGDDESTCSPPVGWLAYTTRVGPAGARAAVAGAQLQTDQRVVLREVAIGVQRSATRVGSWVLWVQYSVPGQTDHLPNLLVARCPVQ